MIGKCIVFETEEDLLKLTGLYDRKDLWEVGFDLDDWDIGFCSKIELPEQYWWLEGTMSGYCCGYQVTLYEGYYYYMVYHS